MCSRDVQLRAIVQAVCPAAIISDAICFKAENYISISDPVPFLSDLDGIMKNLDNVHFLKPHQGANYFFDYEFASPTFRNQNKEGLETYIDTYRKDVK